MKLLIILAAILLNLISGYSFRTVNIVNRINSANTTWRACDKFVQEVGLESLRKRLGINSSWNNLNDEKLTTPPVYSSKMISNAKIPASFDARKKWPKCSSISHIRNQGQCGNCWAIAACSAFSDRLCIASGQKLSVQLSAQQVTFCCKECGDGCDGGYLDGAWKYFTKHGTVTGGDYKSEQGCQPYEIQPSKQATFFKLVSDTYKCVEDKCTNQKYNLTYKQDLYFIKNAYILRNSEKAIQLDILKNGPVQAGFKVYTDFYYYSGGIYSYNGQYPYEGNHAVKIIGWGEEKKIKYWICSNSWGQNWGEGGTFKILRGKNECYIEQYVVAGIPKL